MNFLFLAIQFAAGFALLVGGAEFLVRGASRLAVRFNLPPVLIGLTIVAFGTSLPELVVSLTAALNGADSAIAIGNIVGSNIANLGLILGLAGIMVALPVAASFTRRELPILLCVSLLFMIMAWLNYDIDRLEGALLVVGFGVVTWLSWRAAVTDPDFSQEVKTTVATVEAIDPQAAQPSRTIWVDVVGIVLGLVGLIVGARWLVAAASEIARALGVSELVIGLTLVAIGTSLPEVATSIVAVARGNADIAVGNVVGSNLFNLLAIGGITAMVSPLTVPADMALDFGVMILLTALVWLFAWRPRGYIARWQAAILLGIYVLYIAQLALRSLHVV
ncbi:MAG: calcium/sodium antiporter [Caldilineaceae bacterium]